MKKLFVNSLILFLGLSAILMGCQNEFEAPVLTEINTSVKNEIQNLDPLLIEYLEAIGLKGKPVGKFLDFYLVDGDFLISEENLSDFSKNKNQKSSKGGIGPENLQYRFQNIVTYTPGVIREIRYSFASTVPISGPGSDWRTATTAAFNEWNLVRNFSLRFVPTTGTADIVINAFQDSNSGIAAAFGPNSSGNPGNQIYINTAFNGLDFNWKIQTVAHEIGHTVGFHHTDYNTPGANPNNTPGTIIPGTWNNDVNSIMNHQLTKGWTGFPYLDQLSIRTLFPLDINELPFYTYQKVITGGFNWTPYWSTYGFAAQGFSYWGFNGYVFTQSRPNTVPLYKYRNNVTQVDYMTTNPNLTSQIPSYISQGILAYVYNSSASDRVPVYEYYHPNKGFHFTTILNDNVSTSGGWTGGGIAFYVLKVDQFN